MLGWLAGGYKLPFREPLRRAFHQGVSCRNLQPDARAFLLKELQRCLNTGAYEPATSTRYVTKAFLVPKPGCPGKWRLVLDFRHLNTFLKELSCKYETLKLLRDILEPQDWLLSMDLSDGFHAIPIAPEHRQFLTFAIDGVGYLQCAALPFGLSCSPYVFTKCMRVLVQALRSPARMLELHEEGARSRAAAAREAAAPMGYLPPQLCEAPLPPGDGRTLRNLWRRHREVMRRGLQVLPYMDDFLFIARSRRLALRGRPYVEELLLLLGLSRSPTKGVWEPTQRLKHLGLGVDTRLMVFFLTPDRRDKLVTAAREILQLDRSLVSRRRLQGFCGLAQSVHLAVPPVRRFLRSLYDELRAEPHRSGNVRLRHQARRDLEWFAALPAKWESRPIRRQPETAVVYTDASKSGWGGTVTVDGETTVARGFWRPHERALHINVLEMRAKLLVVHSCPHLVRGRHVRFMGDNLVVTHVANSLTSRSPELMSETRAFFDLLDALDVTSVDCWLSTTDNAVADALSRAQDRGDWRLDPAAFSRLNRRWGPHTVDRFASSVNAQLPRFNSAWAQPAAEGVDAFAQANWRQENNWCNPPWTLLPRVAALLRNSGAAATVVAPDWPAQPWYHELAGMASDVVRLPARPDLFRPGRLGSEQAVGAPRWDAVAFRIPLRRGGGPPPL